jgi:hypothetical protein
MKNYNLFLDDIRMPEHCYDYIPDSRYLYQDWHIVRSHEDFINTLKSKWEAGEFPALVSFDHDLHDDHYHPSMYHGVKAYENAYTEFNHPTGRRSAEFLVKFCKEKNISLPECLVHTMNPAGKERINTTIKGN